MNGALKSSLLLGVEGPYRSPVKGALGGYRPKKIYGRLDCSSALRALPKGYGKRRVFFADEATALACGYRPCGRCLRAQYAAWKARQKE